AARERHVRSIDSILAAKAVNDETVPKFLLELAERRRRRERREPEDLRLGPYADRIECELERADANRRHAACERELLGRDLAQERDRQVQAILRNRTPAGGL